MKISYIYVNVNITRFVTVSRLSDAFKSKSHTVLRRDGEAHIHMSMRCENGNVKNVLGTCIYPHIYACLHIAHIKKPKNFNNNGGKLRLFYMVF